MNAPRLALTLALLTACPADDDDDTGNDTGSATTTASTTTASTTTASTTATETGSESGTTEAADSSSEGGMAGPPVINSITWTQVDGCMMNTGSDVTIVIDVTDPDNTVDELIIDGLAIGCTGDINMPMVTILCPQVATYNATVTVEDPDGGMDQLPIAIMPCMDGMAP